MTIEPTLIVILAVAGVFMVKIVRARYRYEVIVTDGFVGLLSHEGRIVETITPGRSVRWGRNYRATLVDTRKTLLHVPGQDVLSADNVAVKVSVVLTTQIVSAATAVQSADNYVTHIYSAVQTALRTVVSGVTMEALLNQRVSIGGQIRDLVTTQAAAVGVQIHAVEVRDVMLPAELRKAFSEVLKAKQEGQAALERARGESAALRNLANAARLVEGLPALATLRLLQTLESSDAGRTFVLNDVSSLISAMKTRGATSAAKESGEA